MEQRKSNMLANSSILLVFFAHVDVARISNALCELMFQDRTRVPVFDVVSVSCGDANAVCNAYCSACRSLALRLSILVASPTAQQLFES